MTKLAIIGPGLLGGSLALAARQLGGFHVAVWARRAEAVEELQDLAIADEASADLLQVGRDADLVVLCVPVGAMPDLSTRLVEVLRPDTLVTDVGSVKGTVTSELDPIFHKRARFVGSHPMAGSEQTGVRAARADLFVNAACMITPSELTDPSALEAIDQFWKQLGCRTRRISPGGHDQLVAAISHLPHLAAAAMVNAVAEIYPEAFEMAGPGFRDSTRVAGGLPSMWTEIFASNRVAVRNSAEAMIAKLEEFIKLLDSQTPDSETLMNDFLTHAKARRDSLPAREPRTDRP